MLTQKETDYLINVLKILKYNTKIISFPHPTEELRLVAESEELNKDSFLFYVNRKGQYNLKKCTYLSRYNNTYNLLRIDIEGPPHDNPDGTVINCPHIHIYKEGYNLSWAYPLEDIIPTEPKDLIKILIDFLKYTKVKNKDSYSFQGGGLI